MFLSKHGVLATSVLIFSSLSLQFTSHPRHEIVTECICWCLILLGGKLLFRFSSKNSRPFYAAELSVIAFGITILFLTVSYSFQQTVWSTAPLLGPALILIEKGSAFLPEYAEVGDKELGTKSGWFSFSKSGWKRRTISLILCTIIGIVALSRNNSLHDFRLQVCWLFAQLVIYWALFRRVSLSNNIQTGIIEETLHTATELATFMVFTTGSMTVLWWQGVPSIPAIGIVSALKATRWIVVLLLAHESKFSVTAWITVFTVFTNAIWVYPHGWQTGLNIVGSFVALHQTATTSSQSSVAKWIIFLFALVPVWAYGLRHGFADSFPAWHEILSPTQTTLLESITQSTTWNSTHHPIYHLAEEAKARFDSIKSRQSRTLAEAVTEYTRRYGRSPPPGFDNWYKFATENNIQFIDEYDYLTHSFDSYWQMPPSLLRNYVNQVLVNEDANLNTLEVKGHKATLAREGFQHKQLVKLIQPIVHLLPDLKAPLNEPDEPRVLPPYDMLDHDGVAHAKQSDMQAQPVYFSAQDKQIIWNSVTLPCAPHSLARSPFIPSKPNDLWPPFISNLTEAQDICSWPASAATRHGFLSSPSTFHYTQNLVPILSTAKLSTFNDIMIPSSYYFQDDIAQYDESKDLPWEQKKDIVYWRGSGTGGRWHNSSWKHGHRQRFVEFTNSATASIKLFQESAPGKWTAIQSSMSQVLEKFQVHFSAFIQCDEQDCKDQEEHFKKAESDSNDDATQYKILYNLDGNSFSGRYYRFLKSNSVVFMQALFKEWHDDRLFPWVHFVPISLGMEELPETARYLLDDPEGKVIAERIAKESHDWARRVLRPVDLTAAYFRVFLEYARLLDDNRDNLSCC